MAFPIPKHTDRYFFLGSAIFFLLINIVGFSFRINLRLENEGSIASHQYLHGLFAGLWILLYFFQNLAVAIGKLKWHLFLGPFALIILGGILVTGFYMTFKVPLDFLDDPYLIAKAPIDFINFFMAIALAIGGLLKRKTPFLHKRLMFLATLIFSTAGLGRSVQFLNATVPSLGDLPLFKIGLYSLVIIMILYDVLVYRKFFRVHFGGLLLIVLFFAIAIDSIPLWSSDAFKPMITSLVNWVSQL